MPQNFTQTFQPCKDFYGPVDMECNRQIPSTKFEQVPLIKKLVDQFCNLYPHLSIDQVWLIVKSKRGSGFQEWHRDFYLNDKIIRIIVVNLLELWREVMSWGEFLSSEDGKKLMIHPMYLFDNVAALWSDVKA